MIQASARNGADLLLLGIVRGLDSEVSAALEAVDRFRPSAIGLALSDDEANGLREHFVGTDAEPLVPLMGTEAAEIRGLTRFGEVRVPNPAFVALMEWAGKRSVPVEAVDPSDDRYAEMFADHIGYFELVRRTVRERRLVRSPPSAPDADAYAIEWHRSLGRGRDSLRLAQARELALAERLRSLSGRYPRIAIAVDRERFAEVRDRLSAPATG